MSVGKFDISLLKFINNNNNNNNYYNNNNNNNNNLLRETKEIITLVKFCFEFLLELLMI